MNEEKGNEQQITLTLNFEPPDGEFFVRLQRLLDILAVSTAGLACVTDGPYMDFPSYWTMTFAENERLPRLSAIAEAQHWHLRTVVRDAIELTKTFLDECWLVCELLSQFRSQLSRGIIPEHGHAIEKDDDNGIIALQAKKEFHGLNLSRKLKKLRKDFGVSSKTETHILSINKVRNCLVHRLGIVSDQDVDDNGELTIIWCALEIVSQSPDKTQEIVLREPGAVGKSGWSIVIRWPDKQKMFRKGERIGLSGEEITYIFFSLMHFGKTLVQSFREYGNRIGIRVNTNLLSKSGQRGPKFDGKSFEVR